MFDLVSLPEKWFRDGYLSAETTTRQCNNNNTIHVTLNSQTFCSFPGLCKNITDLWWSLVYVVALTTHQQKRWPLPQSTAGAWRRGKLKGSEVELPGPWVLSRTALSHPASGHQRIAGLFSTNACNSRKDDWNKSAIQESILVRVYLFPYFCHITPVTSVLVSAWKDYWQNYFLLGANLLFNSCKCTQANDFKIWKVNKLRWKNI